MSGSPPATWTTGQPPNRVAALPAGLLGAIGGRLMRATNADQQREIAGLVEGPVADVLEVGCGPGVLLGLLAARPEIGRLTGIDPSPVMRRQTVRALGREIAAGRLAVRDGQAAATGLPAGAVDLVVSVNTVAIWPDLDAGLAELHRVLRPGGRLLVSWHGGHRPTRMSRRLQLPADRWERITAAAGARFGTVRRLRTRRSTVLDARV